MKINKLVFILLFQIPFYFFSINKVNAQIFRRDTTQNDNRRTGNTESNSWRDRVRLGGNFGLQFGNITFIDVSPLVLYQVTDRTQFGVGITYQYVRFNNVRTFGGGTLSSSGNSIYGGRTFMRYFLFPGIFAQGEYEMLSTRYYDYSSLTPELKRALVPAGFVGGGYSQPISGRSAFNITVLYNLLYEQYRAQSIYASPLVIRAGVTL
jgi:hypothetical protein